MVSTRLLVFGDNHGNTTSLEKVVDEVEGKKLDYVIHVGDMTSGGGDEDFRNISPYFDELASFAPLVYTWGNREGYDREDDPLEPGTLITKGESAVVDGQRFTCEPTDVGTKDILITHPLYHQLLDNFDGLAYFSGHVHAGRVRNNILNSAFLFRDRNPLLGGYFIVEISESGNFQVEFRNFGRLKKILCPKHSRRGVLFQPDYHECMFCKYPKKLPEELIINTWFRLIDNQESERVSVEQQQLVNFCKEMYGDTPDSFIESIQKYVNMEYFHPTDVLSRLDDGKLIQDYY
ncbi:metallophosphoesterase family protein [Haloarcula sp. AONF1]